MEGNWINAGPQIWPIQQELCREYGPSECFCPKPKCWGPSIALLTQQIWAAFRRAWSEEMRLFTAEVNPEGADSSWAPADYISQSWVASILWKGFWQSISESTTHLSQPEERLFLRDIFPTFWRLSSVAHQIITSLGAILVQIGQSLYAVPSRITWLD